MREGKPEDLNDPQEEEARSLCDLPINTCEQTNSEEFTRHNDDDDGRSPSSQLPELFEFLSDLSTEMCAAEDIIISGKIVPLNVKDQQKQRNALRRRPESLPGQLLLETTRRSNSHSLDYCTVKLDPSSSSDPPPIERNPSVKSSGKAHMSAPTKSPKSRWYLLMFGLIKFPPEMELKDIKSRQVRRNPSAMFPSLVAGGKVPASRTGRKGQGSWRLFNVLSCKDHASISVTTSFGRMHLV